MGESGQKTSRSKKEEKKRKSLLSLELEK